MKFKKLFAGAVSLAAALFAVCAITVCAGADIITDNYHTYGDYQYLSYDNKTAEIVKYSGSDTSLEIPSTIEGIKVTSIGYYAFGYSANLKSITIPDSVTNILYGAFIGCPNLISITIPDSVTCIEADVFSDTPFLDDQTAAVKYAGKWVIDCDDGATAATIKSGTVGIAGSAFDNCSNLKSIAIPDSVKSIGDGAFSYCSKLASINIPDSVKSMGSGVFYDTALLNKQTAAVKYAGKWAVDCDKDAATATIKSGTAGIASEAFFNCSNLSSVTIPDSVTIINDDAFTSGLKDVYYMGSKAQWDKISVGNNYYLLSADTHYIAVSGLKLKARAADALRLSWDKNTSADGYIIEMKDGSKWTRVGKITNNSTVEFKKSKLKAGTAYTFRVKAYKMDGKTALYSGYTTISASTSPSAVSGFKLKARSSSTMHLTWGKNTSADGYILEQKSGGTWKRIAKFTKNSTVECRITGLKAGTAYSFRIKSYKMSGKTALYSGYTTLSARTDPTEVSGFKLKARSSSVLRLTWGKNTSADGYILEQKSGGTWKRIAKFTKNTTAECRITGLKAGTAYSFRIKSYKMSGKTALYSGYTTLSARTDPTAVSGLKLKAAAKDAVRLAWDKNTSADGYIVEMKSGTKWVRVGKITKNSTAQFKKSKLKSKTSYTFRVKVYKMSGKTALYGATKTITVKTK